MKTLIQNKLDKVALVLLGTLVLLIVVVGLFGSQVGVRVTLVWSGTSGEVGARGPILLRFSQPVNADKLKGLLEVAPSVKEIILQSDRRTVEFVPDAPLDAQGSYTVRVKPGVVGINGDTIKFMQEWTVKVRSPRILYLNVESGVNELWTIGLDGGDARQLTDTNNQLFSNSNTPMFSASPNGEQIVYTVINKLGGHDLWLVDRNGNNARPLLECQSNRCKSPVFSPDSNQIAYTRQDKGTTSDSPAGVPRPWLVDVRTGQQRPVFADLLTMGYGSFWSPDNRWLGSYDQLNKNLQIVELSSGKTLSFPSNLIGLGSWSADSRYIFYRTIIGDGEQKHTSLMRAEVSTGKITAIMGDKDPFDHSYSLPVWSPDGSKVFVTMLDKPGTLLEHILVGRDLSDLTQLFTPIEDYTYGNFHLHTRGNAIVFQGSEVTL